MIIPWTNPLLLRGLYVVAMARAFLKYRNPRRRTSGKHQSEFYEQTWCAAAKELGASWTSLGSDISEISLDGHRTRVFHNVSSIDDPVTLAVLHDKPLTHRILTAEELPVPRYCVFNLKDLCNAASFLKSSERECVVKPAGGTGGGRGVTTGVRTLSHLVRAAAAAAVYSDEVLIEEQIDGENYRLLYLDGRLIDSFVRRRPAVVGDGKSTVAQLVQKENEERLESPAGVSQVLLSIDLDMHRTLAKQGYALRSVPPAGANVSLKTVINENSGADNSTATNLLCDSIVNDGARAVRALGVRFAGIDIICRDPSIPLAESGGVILEVNGTPNLYYHYKKKDGVFPVAVHLLRRLLPVESVTANNGSSAPTGQELETSHV
jgi:D-alanine-D-alanine ligase-like ATP-grasp enzyme